MRYSPPARSRPSRVFFKSDRTPSFFIAFCRHPHWQGRTKGTAGKGCTKAWSGAGRDHWFWQARARQRQTPNQWGRCAFWRARQNGDLPVARRKQCAFVSIEAVIPTSTYAPPRRDERCVQLAQIAPDWALNHLLSRQPAPATRTRRCRSGRTPLVRRSPNRSHVFGVNIPDRCSIVAQVQGHELRRTRDPCG